MKYLKAEIPVALALLIFGLGYTLEHAALTHGGVLLWSGLLIMVHRHIHCEFSLA